MTFGFREPYQVIVDAEMVKDSCRYKMDLEPALHRTVHGKVKPMITQCEIRKLYASKSEPNGDAAIELAKTLERRRCGHHPDEYPEPLSTHECLLSIVDPKSTGVNKHRYVVASQDVEVRRLLRTVKGTPLIYIKRSVMILEPMADESAQVRSKEERMKFRADLKNQLGKRKRAKEGDEDGNGEDEEVSKAAKEKKKIKAKGPKEPNPLSVKKAKKPQQPPQPAGEGADGEAPAKKKRKRKSRATKRENTEGEGPAATAAAEEDHSD